MSAPANRAARRSMGKRHFHRAVVNKRKEAVALREQGYGAEVIASRLALRRAEAQEIVHMIDEVHAEREATATLGGGG
jgi:hypothetical protein